MKSKSGDISDVNVSKNLISSKPDIIFHLAAQAIVSTSYTDPFETISSNTMGTTNILEALRSSDEFTQNEKDSIMGFTNAKLDYSSRASWENSLTKFGCVLDLN